MKILASAVMMVLAGPAGAEEWQLAGHQVVLEPAEAGGYRLFADGAPVLEDLLILPDGTGEIGGGAMVYGVSGPSGHACDASPFVLWLPEGAPARLDGPIETCSLLTPEVADGQVVWTSERLPGRLTETWLWTAAGGIEAAPSTPFAPDAGRGWEAVTGLQGSHPAEALRLEPVYAVLAEGLGTAFDTFGERISGLGSGGLTGPDYYGEACIKEVCDTDFAGIWLDAPQRQVFVFWAESEADGISHFPEDLALWPKAALDKLGEHGK